MSKPLTTASANCDAYVLEDATVVMTDGVVSVVRGPRGDVRAERAASCLCAPEPMDRVLVAHSGVASFVIAILVRAKQGAMRLESDAPIEIVSRAGSVRLVASEDVEMLAGRTLAVASSEMNVTSKEARVRVDRLGFLGTVAELGVHTIRMTADSVERTAGRLIERLTRSYRFIEEAEHVRANEIDVRAESTLALRGEHTIVTATKLVKVDGSQIHMG